MLTDGKIEGNVPDSVILPAMKICEEENLIVPDVIISARYPVKKLLLNQVMDEQLEVKAHTEPLWLVPRSIILGMGCKRGKSCEEIEQFVLETLEQEQIAIQAVNALATIDLKKKNRVFAICRKIRVGFSGISERGFKRNTGFF